MTKIKITITDEANGIKQTLIRETQGDRTLTEMLEAFEDSLRGMGFVFEGHLTINNE